MRKLLLVGLVAAAPILVASTETVSACGWATLAMAILLRAITATQRRATMDTPRTRRDASMGREYMDGVRDWASADGDGAAGSCRTAWHERTTPARFGRL